MSRQPTGITENQQLCEAPFGYFTNILIIIPSFGLVSNKNRCKNTDIYVLFFAFLLQQYTENVIFLLLRNVDSSRLIVVIYSQLMRIKKKSVSAIQRDIAI